MKYVLSNDRKANLDKLVLIYTNLLGNPDKLDYSKDESGKKHIATLTYDHEEKEKKKQLKFLNKLYSELEKQSLNTYDYMRTNSYTLDHIEDIMKENLKVLKRIEVTLVAMNYRRIEQEKLKSMNRNPLFRIKKLIQQWTQKLKSKKLKNKKTGITYPKSNDKLQSKQHI